jgi:E3 ubiquitin-protein ligase UBR1
MVLMLNGECGSWSYATLRRHHQLFLSQRRYDKLLREVWLRQGVESAIARRLEGESNTGGWESL